MAIVIPIPDENIAVLESYRTFSGPVVDSEGNPAINREVLILRKNEFAAWTVAEILRTDSSGNYTVTIPAGANDRFIIVGVGDPVLGEYSDILGNMTGEE